MKRLFSNEVVPGDPIANSYSYLKIKKMKLAFSCKHYLINDYKYEDSIDNVS